MTVEIEETGSVFWLAADRYKRSGGRNSRGCAVATAALYFVGHSLNVGGLSAVILTPTTYHLQIIDLQTAEVLTLCAELYSTTITLCVAKQELVMYGTPYCHTSKA